MKKWLFSLTVLIFLLVPAPHAYAGTINDNEAAVLEAAKGQFDVDGVKYRVDDTYLKQLTAYLGSNEVDLTAEQKDQLLVAVNSYVEAGVEGGYLIPVENQEKPDASEAAEPSVAPKDNTATEDQQDQSTNTKEEDIIDSDIIDADTKDRNDKDKVSEDTGNANTENPAAPDTSSEEPDLEAPAEVIATEDENQVVIEETDHIIKNTGFNLNRTITIIGGLGILMLISMFVTIKYKFIAQSDE